MLTWPRFQNTDWHLSRSEFECYKNKTKQNKTRQVFHTNTISPGRTRAFMTATKPGVIVQGEGRMPLIMRTQCDSFASSPCSSFSPNTKHRELPTVSPLSYQGPVVGFHPNPRQMKRISNDSSTYPVHSTNKCTIY